jgi:hypothetical protein
VCIGVKESEIKIGRAEFGKTKISALENDGNESQSYGLIEIDEADFELEIPNYGCTIPAWKNSRYQDGEYVRKYERVFVRRY